MVAHNKKDAAEALHAFEVVCRTALKLASHGSHFRHGNGGLTGIGMSEFGLTKSQSQYCLGRARSFLAEVREADRARNKAVSRAKPSPWSYLCLLLFAVSAPAQSPTPAEIEINELAAPVTFTWKKSPSSDVIGQRFYIKIAPEGAASPTEVGSASTYTVKGLKKGQHYYFFVTAYNACCETQSNMVELQL